MRTTLGNLMKVPTMGISGQSGSLRNVAQYIDFYLLLDNSPSMGLAATAADISNMKRVAAAAPSPATSSTATEPRTLTTTTISPKGTM